MYHLAICFKNQRSFFKAEKNFYESLGGRTGTRKIVPGIQVSQKVHACSTYMNLRTKKQEHTSLSLRFSVLAVVAVARRAAAAADGAALRRDPLRWYTIRTPGAQLNAPTGPYT